MAKYVPLQSTSNFGSEDPKNAAKRSETTQLVPTNDSCSPENSSYYFLSDECDAHYSMDVRVFFVHELDTGQSPRCRSPRPYQIYSKTCPLTRVNLQSNNSFSSTNSRTMSHKPRSGCPEAGRRELSAHESALSCYCFGSTTSSTGKRPEPDIRPLLVGFI